MVSDTGLICMSLISLAGMVLLFMLNNSMWFKKQNFKIEKSNVMATNKLQLRKLEREMGLIPTKGKQQATTALGGIGKLLPLLKTLEPEQLSGLLEAYIGTTEDEGGGEPIDLLMEFAEDHPEVVQGIIGKLTGKGDQQGTETVFNK